MNLCKLLYNVLKSPFPVLNDSEDGGNFFLFMTRKKWWREHLFLTL